MGNCVDCMLDLCEVLVCDSKSTLKVPQVANQTGTYRFVFNYINTAKVYDVNITSGSLIQIDLDCLNENYCYEGFILQPDATVLTIFTDKAYTGIKFCTKQISIC